MPPLHVERDTQIVFKSSGLCGIAHAESQRLAQETLGFQRPVKFVQLGREALLGKDVIWLKTECLAAAFFRFDMVAFRRMCERKAEMGLCVIGLEPYGFAQGSDSVIEPALGSQQISEIMMDLWVSRAQLKRLTIEALGFCILSLNSTYDAQQLERIRNGNCRERAKKTFRLQIFATIQMPKRHLKCRADFDITGRFLGSCHGVNRQWWDFVGHIYSAG
jgi:hypothetical protein